MDPVKLPAFLLNRREEVLELAARHGATNVRIFGSLARGEARSDSDVDILVSMTPGRSYFDFVALWQDLEELLGRKVDVVSDRGMSPYLRDRILSEARSL
ncbi:MAG TPA: nucleotidyltransferase family protein [Bdellovibrionota bacterium]|nr:nucleotidyltransferase family protein [Bdellovibrionota bacterium]